MNLFKIGEQGNLVPYRGQCIKIDGIVYTNPSEEILLADGFRPLAAVELPAFDIETQDLKADSYHYSEDGSEIITVYIVVEQEEKEMTIEERVALLEQEGLARDAALIELAAIVAGEE